MISKENAWDSVKNVFKGFYESLGVGAGILLVNTTRDLFMEGEYGVAFYGAGAVVYVVNTVVNRWKKRKESLERREWLEEWKSKKS